jgi:regulator of sirC expression with transglutaminase-like and TPR domain
VEAFARFSELVRGPDASIPLDEVALYIAAHADPAVDVAKNLAVLDELGETCPAPTLDALVAHLFGPGRFAGNRADYYDPRNSFLHEVLERRVGIPITLSVLALEVGRRIGVPLSGVGLPGHFLLRDKVDDRVFIDPFHHGRLLDEAGCRKLHRTLVGDGARWDPSYLDAVSRRSIVLRLLNNLKAIYLRRADVAALAWVLKLRSAVPGAPQDDQEAYARLMARYN